MSTTIAAVVPALVSSSIGGRQHQSSRKTVFRKIKYATQPRPSQRKGNRWGESLKVIRIPSFHPQVTDWAGLGCEESPGGVEWLDVGSDSISMQVRTGARRDYSFYVPCTASPLKIELLQVAYFLVAIGSKHASCRFSARGYLVRSRTKSC